MTKFYKTYDGEYIPISANYILGSRCFFRKEYLSYKEARAFVRKLKLKNLEEWYKYCKSGKKPNNVPNSPIYVYGGNDWVSWGDFLGTGRVVCTKPLSYEEAKNFAAESGIKSISEWMKFFKDNGRVSNIPFSPDIVYRGKGWIDWASFFGTKNVYRKDFFTFSQSRTFVRKLKLKSQNEWREYIRSGKKPDKLPAKPELVYKNKGWTSFGDFLGTGHVHGKYKKYLSFKEARIFARKLKLKSQNEWWKYCTSGKKPDNVNSNPNRYYKNKGWKGYGDFLGTGNVSKKDFLSFKQARSFVRKLKLKGQKEWTEYSKSGKRPNNIPGDLSSTYKDKGWVSLVDFLGSSNTDRLNIVSFKEAKSFARKLKLKSSTEWKTYCKLSKIPNIIPNAPYQVYKNKGWKGWGDFLGTGVEQTQSRRYLSYKDAKSFVRGLKITTQTEWFKYARSGKKPHSLPVTLNQVYKNKGWISWPDFLGTKK